MDKINLKAPIKSKSGKPVVPSAKNPNYVHPDFRVATEKEVAADVCRINPDKDSMDDKRG